MKAIRKFVAAIMSAVMLAASAQGASAANLADYYTVRTIDQVIEETGIIKDGVTYSGFLENMYDQYWYRIECKNAGTLTLNAEVGVSDWNMDLYDANGDNIRASKFSVAVGKGKYEENGNLELDWDKNKKNTVLSASYKVKKGTYIAQICSFQDKKKTGKVLFRADFPKASSASVEQSQKKLIYTAVSDIKKKAGFYQYLGRDLYYIADNNGKGDIYRIDATVLESWRKTGKLKAKKLTVDTSVSSNSDWSVLYSFTNGNYGVLTYQKNGIKYYSAVKYNKKSGSITAYYTSDVPFSVSPEGYISQWKRSNGDKQLTLDLFNNKGKKVKTLSFDVTDQYWNYWQFTGNAYCGLSVGTYDEKNDKWSGSVYLIDRFGNKTTLKKYAARAGYLRTNYFLMIKAGTSAPTEVYSFDKKKTYSLSGKELSGFTVNGRKLELTRLDDRLWGTKSVALYSDSLGMSKMYALIDVSTGKLVSKSYYNMVTYDGKIFRVKNEKGQYGYIDANGMELGWFSDAAAFAADGKYAPVLKNGQTYLIDRNMKKVSLNADLGSLPLLTTYGSELYTWFDMKNNYFMTYAQ